MVRVLQADGWVATHLERQRPAPLGLGDGVRAVLIRTKQSVVTVRVDHGTEMLNPAIGQVIELGGGARQLVAVTTQDTYVFTQSSGPAAELQQFGKVFAAASSVDAALSTLRAQLPGIIVEQSKGPVSPAGLGYSITYNSGMTMATLAVYPLQPGAPLAFVVAGASVSPIRELNGVESIVVPSTADTTPQLWWIDRDVLVMLSTQESLMPELQRAVSASGAMSFDEFDQQLVHRTMSSPPIVAATVAGISMTKRDGADGVPVLCAESVDRVSTTCVAFAAAGSLATFKLDGSWYVAAIVPAKEPTTAFRTEPALTFQATTSGPWRVSLAAVPVGLSRIQLFYSTEGLGMELSQELTFG